MTGCDLLSMLHPLACAFLWVSIIFGKQHLLTCNVTKNGGEMDSSTRGEIIVIVPQRLGIVCRVVH